jgi:hypothetical protein
VNSGDEKPPPPLTEGATFHRVNLKVRPLPGHPTYYDWQFGYFGLWLFANSIDDARDRALLIVGALPYEVIGDKVSVETNFPRTEESRAMNGRAQETAGEIGLAMSDHAQEVAEGTGLGMCLFSVRTGADETSFEGSPL